MSWRLFVARRWCSRLRAPGGAQHGRVPAGRYLGFVQPAGKQGRADHPVCPLAVAALDSFAVARIDTASFTEKNIIAKATFDDRPSTANQQKRAFASRVEKFVDESRSAPYTDITGGPAAGDRVSQREEAGPQEILIFSDMKEELAKVTCATFRLISKASRLWRST